MMNSALLVASGGLLVATLVTPAISFAFGPGIGNVPQRTQPDSMYAKSFSVQNVTNVYATSQADVSCYRPEEVPPPPLPNVAASEGYTGETACPGATTGEDIGTTPYPTQKSSASGYPSPGPMQVKDHAESNVRVDPTNPNHLIGTAKWFVSAEGDSNVNGFFESFDGGNTWPVQGHIPGYEGWTQNTDPVGAFDGEGNFYVLMLPYQFTYDSNGARDYGTGQSQLPNPSLPAEAIAIAVRPHGQRAATAWISTHMGQPDVIAAYPTNGQSPDKPWLAIDTHKTLPNGLPNPHYDTIYAMWVTFDAAVKASKPYVSTAHAMADGTHTAWSTPQVLPTVNGTANDYYPSPVVAPDGVVWAAMQHYPSAQSRSTADIEVISSSDGGQTWRGPSTVVQGIVVPPNVYPNTTFLYDQIITFAVGPKLSSKHAYPLYVGWEDFSTGTNNLVLSSSIDGGLTWSAPIQVNDNVAPADMFQPTLSVADSGVVGLAFYDRRLTCPAAGPEATQAGIDLDTLNPTGLPPYGAANYCVNASIQFYSSTLQPLGQNIRLTGHTWDPQVNAIRTSCQTCTHTWIGDYFGSTDNGSLSISSVLSTFDPGDTKTNPKHLQQQIIATVPVPPAP